MKLIAFALSLTLALYGLIWLTPKAQAADTPKEIYYRARLSYPDVGTHITYIPLSTISSVWPKNWNMLDDNGATIGISEDGEKIIAALRTLGPVFCVEKSTNPFCFPLSKVSWYLPSFPGNDDYSAQGIGGSGDRATVFLTSKVVFLQREDFDRLLEEMKKVGTIVLD